jgi:cardiolipin synthase (CMP-forming)
MALNLATQITLLRILSAPLFVVLLFQGALGWAMLVFGLASLTDTFDGFIARKYGQESNIGKILDPAADKVLLTTAFVALSVPSLHLASAIPLWLVILSIVRDVLISLGALLIWTCKRRKTFPPTLSGKISTTLQMVTVCVSLAGCYQGVRWVIFSPLVYATLFFTIVSGLDYLHRAVAIMRQPKMRPQQI